ncbi:hypothetical protein Ciccas_001766 [Cichlidogyrus casuarinus]|uniref:Ig-like domain-containing protein n=1 Tax=Cichlidogyrus casuarinus TaxID=1844966 RepID=A0ABD2QJ38_9PLAT
MDEFSVEHKFQTSDDIQVDVRQVGINRGRALNVSCEAAVGPKDGNAKLVYWRKQDHAPLPPGMLSEPASDLTRFGESPRDNPYDLVQKAFLTIDSSEAHYSGLYACFVDPPVDPSIPHKALLQLTVNGQSLPKIC